ncbi:MAG: type II toxin-antitoxin system HicA family toxin [Methylococcales bacterium]|nr:type II toxin-antitoxin system HicA family toxin [Methylococcales bacterium]
MTPKAKRLTAKEIIRILLKHDFEEVSQTGSPIKFFNIKTRKTVIVPFYQVKELPIGTLKSIEKQSGLDFV